MSTKKQAVCERKEQSFYGLLAAGYLAFSLLFAGAVLAVYFAGGMILNQIAPLPDVAGFLERAREDGINDWGSFRPEEYLGEDALVFVAEDDGKIIGAVIAGSDGRRGYIYHTAVSKEHRRQKVGTKLLDSCLGAFKRHGIIKSAIVVFSSNKDGNAFWKKNGFSVRNDLLYRDKVLLEPGMV